MYLFGTDDRHGPVSGAKANNTMPGVTATTIAFAALAALLSTVGAYNNNLPLRATPWTSSATSSTTSSTTSTTSVDAAPKVSSRRDALAAGAAFLGAVGAPLAASADGFVMPSGLENLRYPDGSGVDGPAPAPAPATPPAEAAVPMAAVAEEAAPAPAPAVAAAATAAEGETVPAPAPATPAAYQIDMSKVKDVPVSTSKMGGLLEPFADVGKGWRILKPYGWNQFDTRPGVYEEKWTDIVAANNQNLVVTTVPVKSTTTSVDALGEVTKVAAKLAEKRGASVVDASAYSKEGILFYQFEFKTESIHQLLTFCVAKGKLWQIDASAPESRWSKVEELLTKSILSFFPRL